VSFIRWLKQVSGRFVSRVRRGLASIGPAWLLPAIFSLSSVLIAVFLDVTGEEVSVNPWRDGTLLEFSVVFAFTSLTAFLADLPRHGGVQQNIDRFLWTVGAAFLIGSLAWAKYTALILTEGGGAHHPLLGIAFASGALVYGFNCERLRQNLDIAGLLLR
jgi:hypothetical protein